MDPVSETLSWFVCTDTAGLRELWPAWERLAAMDPAAGFYLSPAWLQAVLELTPDDAQELRVICLQANSEIVAIAPFVIRPGRTRLFRVRELRLLGNIYSAQRGLLVAPGLEQAAAARLAGILVDDMGNDWDRLVLEDVPEQDVFVPLLQERLRARGASCQGRPQYGVVHSRLADYSDGKQFLAHLSKSLRQIIRRELRRMNRRGELHAVLYSSPGAQLQAAMSDYIHLYDQSWKESEQYPEFHARFAQMMATTGRLRLFLLYHVPGEDEGALTVESELSGKRPESASAVPLAAYYFIVDRRVAYYLKTVYDPAWREYSPGTVLFWFALRHLLETDNVTYVDHQKGVEPYKLRWAGVVRGNNYSYSACQPRRRLLRLEAWLERMVHALSTRARAAGPE